MVSGQEGWGILGREAPGTVLVNNFPQDVKKPPVSRRLRKNDRLGPSSCRWRRDRRRSGWGWGRLGRLNQFGRFSGFVLPLQSG